MNDVIYKFSESFDVIAGLRWAANDQKFHQISGGALLPTENIPGESDEDVFTYALSPPELNNKFDVQLPEVPEWSGAITADYSFTAFGGRDAHIGAGWRYVDERHSEVVTLTDDLAYVLPEYDVVDLNADVQFDTVTVRVFVKNLTEERAFTGGGTTVGGLNFPVPLDLSPLRPRTVGLSVDVQF